MTNMESRIEDESWQLVLKTQQLAGLLDATANLKYFEKQLPEPIEQAHQLVQIADELAGNIERMADQVHDEVASLVSRFSTPRKGDQLPGEFILDMLEAITPDTPIDGSASRIAFVASVLANYAELDETLKPALDFMMEQIRKQGCNPKLVVRENIGFRVEFHQPIQQGG